MILPDPTRWDREPTLEEIVIAWDFSQPAARAVADALPILQRARTVRAVPAGGILDRKSERGGLTAVRCRRKLGAMAA